MRCPEAEPQGKWCLSLCFLYFFFHFKTPFLSSPYFQMQRFVEVCKGVWRYGKQKAENYLQCDCCYPTSTCLCLHAALPHTLFHYWILVPASPSFHVPRLCPANLFLQNSSLVSLLKPLADLFPMGFGLSASFPRIFILPTKAFDL